MGLTLFAQALSQNQTLMSFKIFGNNFGQECLKLFYELFQIGRENPWFPDFVVYWVDDHFEMAYIETNIESESDERRVTDSELLAQREKTNFYLRISEVFKCDEI